MESPAEPFQDILPQSIPFARPERTVVALTVTLHGENIPARPVTLPYAEIDSKPCATNLRIDFIPEICDYRGNIFLERTFRSQPGR